MHNHDRAREYHYPPREAAQRLGALAGDFRNWLLLAAAALSAVAVFSLFTAHGMGARWTGWFSIVVLVSIVCDRRVRAVASGAWSEIRASAADRRTLPWRAVLLLVALPNLVLLLCHAPGIQTGDSRGVVMTAASLLTEGNAELSEYAELYRRRHWLAPGQELPYFLMKNSAGTFSHYPSGMLPFALPLVAVARLMNADLQHPIVEQHLEQLAAALVAAACATLFFLLAWHIVPPATALFATILLAAGSVMYSTIGQALWQHGGVVFWTEVLLLIEFRTWQRHSWPATAAQGVALAMMMACRLSAAAIVAPFGLWVLVRSPMRAVKLAGVAALAAMPWMAFNWRLYGNFSGPMLVQTQGCFWSSGTVASWAGIFFSPTHGLLIYQPWLLLALAGLWPAAKHNGPAHCRSQSSRDLLEASPGWRCWALSVVVMHLVMIGGWWCWWGGLCWGSRLASEAVPLAAMLSLRPVSALLQSRSGRTVAYALLLVSILLHVPSVWLHQDRWYDGMESAAQEANAWQWRSPPFLYPLTRAEP